MTAAGTGWWRGAGPWRSADTASRYVILVLILAILILILILRCRWGAGAGRGCPAPGAPGGSPACGGSRPGAPASKVPTAAVVGVVVDDHVVDCGRVVAGFYQFLEQAVAF